MRAGSELDRWQMISILLPILLGGGLLMLRPSVTEPRMFESFLRISLEVFFKMDRPHWMSPIVALWAASVITAQFFFAFVFLIPKAYFPKGLRELWNLTIGILPATAATGMFVPFVWPIGLIAGLGVIYIPICTLAGIWLTVWSFRNQVRPDRSRIPWMVACFGWLFFFLVVGDAVNVHLWWTVQL